MHSNTVSKNINNVNQKSITTCSSDNKTKVCSGRGKSYCLVHRRYFETSWCPDCH
ncbi:hypothetical protein BDA99DRAFT_83006 [Phascolomyces articulosus]|uniref:Uncharacterized protein n=1 Tax=Phascolomyces articulosus TaxID=60185 RepID=A0AAD5K8M8_9FUNG|nr:hypothetical protein BDA99DRAFT_83006 [Phascolomyces articulosus]